MKLTISFKHLEHTPALDARIQEKARRFEKFLGGELDVKWTCTTDQGVHHTDIALNGPSFHFQASADSENLYKSFDLAVNKLEKQLQRQKAKWRNKLHRPGHKDLTYLEPENAWSDYDEKAFGDIPSNY